LQCLTTNAAFVLSLSKDGRIRLAVIRQAHHWVVDYR